MMFESQICSRNPRQFFRAILGEHDDQPRGFFDAHGGVVHQHGVPRAHERGHFAFAIAAVALYHFVENFGERHLLAFFLVLFPAAFRALFRRCIQKNLQLGVWENDGSDVPPFHHDSAAPTGALLLGDQYATHSGNRCESRRRLRHCRSTNFPRHVCTVEEYTIGRARRFLLRFRGL